MDIWSLIIAIISFGLLLFVWHVGDVAIDRQWQRQEMKNFEFVWHGKKFWYSRSVICVGAVFGKDKDGNEYILATNRGKGGRDRWAMPCGYLDFNESAEERVAKSILSDTGLKISLCDLELGTISSEPTEFKQNVVMVFTAVIDDNVEDVKFDYDTNDIEHVEVVKWIPVKDINTLNWVFNHGAILDAMRENPAKDDEI